MADEKKLQNWAEALRAYEIPDWDALPKLNLYMDQVIVLMEEYLNVYKKPNENLITQSMINNYVKLGVVPKPDKKRYGRIHLAYLIMVCSLKQILSISMIQKMIPLTLTEKEVREAYTAFKSAQKNAFSEVITRASNSFRDLQGSKSVVFSDYFGAAVEIALTGNIYKVISEVIAGEMEGLLQ